MKTKKILRTVLFALIFLSCFAVKGALAASVDGFDIQCTNGSAGSIELSVSPQVTPIITQGYTYNRILTNTTPPTEACGTGWVWKSWKKNPGLTVLGTHTFECTTYPSSTPANCVVVEASFPVALQYFVELFGIGTWVTVPGTEQIVPFAFPPTGVGALDDGETYAVIPEINMPLSETLRIYGSPSCGSLTFTQATQLSLCEHPSCEPPDITTSYTCIIIAGHYNITIPSVATYSGAFEKCFQIPTIYFPGCEILDIPAFDTGDLICCALNNLVALINSVYPGSFSVTVNCEDAPCDCDGTAITLSSFTVEKKLGGNRVAWTTESELDNAGFNVYRSETSEGGYAKMNDFLIPAEGSTTEGASYFLIDTDVRAGENFYYKLEDIDFSGIATMHGPVRAPQRFGFVK